MNKTNLTVNQFADLIHRIIKSDRYVLLGCAGEMGEGKTTFTSQLQKAYGQISGTGWDFDRMTWSRKELMMWIDGEGDDKTNQLPEYSAILPDEIFHMFYKRTWFDNSQIDAVSTLNMCRDRHLFIAGNIPDIWDLDSGFLNRLTFYVFIPERGVAWVFQKEANPFTRDKWNVAENKKVFRKKKKPYGLPNFVFEVRYDDFPDSEKRRYLAIRNRKRVEAISEPRKKVDKYRDIKDQRDAAIQAWHADRETLAKTLHTFPRPIQSKLKAYKKAPTNDEIADVLGLSREVVRMIKFGER